MDKVQIFKNELFGEVRTVAIDNEIWFVLVDICKALGIKNATQLASRLDEDERAMFNIGRQGEASIINESGLYKVIFRSDKKEAKEFTKWVTSEILPTVRKYGVFATEELLKNPDFLIQALTELKNSNEEKKFLENTNQELKGTIEIQTQLIEENRPKLEYFDVILASEDTMAITQIAADYGLSGKRLNKILYEQDFIRNVNKQWILYKGHMNKGYTKSDTFIVQKNDGTEKVIPNTKYTQKGRLKIHGILASLGIKANFDKN